jgi:hypothetical protein
MKLSIREILIKYTEDLMQYTHESHSILGNDERELAEFVDIFLKSREICGQEMVSIDHGEVAPLPVKSYTLKVSRKYLSSEEGAESIEELNY